MHSSYDVVISGMGPAGLAVGFEALKAGKKILLVTDRDDKFYRMQRVFLNIKSRKYLAKMLDENKTTKLMNKDDIKFLRELHDSISISIKDIENYLKRRIDEFPKTSCNYAFRSQLSQISLDKGLAVIESLQDISHSQKIHFKYFIGADGDNHHSVNVLNESLDSKENKI